MWVEYFTFYDGRKNGCWLPSLKWWACEVRIEGVSKRKQRRLVFTIYDKHNKGAIALNIKKNRQQNIIMGAMYNNGCHNNFLYTTLLPQIQQQRILDWYMRTDSLQQINTIPNFGNNCYLYYLTFSIMYIFYICSTLIICLDEKPI